MGLPFLLLLLLVAASCSGKSNLEGPFDNVLALTWPQNACTVNNWNAPGCSYSYWTIHGWWPRQGGTWNTDVFDYNKIKNIRNIKSIWPDLSNRKKLWAHEWNKHGKPAHDKLTLLDYFNRAMIYYSGVYSCRSAVPQKAKACFENLSSVKKCFLMKKQNLIIEARLYLK